MLKKMFNLQKKLNSLAIDKERHDGFFEDLCTNDAPAWEDLRIKWLLDFNRAQMHESMEFEDCLPWKWWKHGLVDRQNLKVELVDELHFFISKCLVAGIDAEELFRVYKQKLDLNIKRQNEGYRTGEYQKIIDGEEDNRSIK